MSSRFEEKCGRGSSGSSASDDLVAVDPTESDFALELKPAPKQTCIPLHQRQRMVNSATSVFQRDLEYTVPDKSWSVLYIGGIKDKGLK
ncbi:hypothetical protein KR074_001044 [Drosophila pseudoananassae]|nr:hypothetical protein KR074_001044 [Drosophila pseudoananassae]